MQKSDEEFIDLGNVLAILLSGKWIFAFSILISVIAAYTVFTLTAPVYTATAMIQVEQKQGGGLSGFGSLDAMLAGETKSATELQVIRSRFILGEVVKRQQLNVVVKPKLLPVIGGFLVRSYESEYGELNTPSIFGNSYNTGGHFLGVTVTGDADVLPRKFNLRVLDASSAIVVGGFADGTVLKFGQITEMMSGKLFVTLDKLVANKDAEFSVSIYRSVDSANQLKARLSLEEQGRQSGIIKLWLAGENPQETQATLKSIVDYYQEQNVLRLSEEASNSIEFLEQQIPNVRAQLESAEEALNVYRSQTNSLDMGLETQAVLGQLLNIEKKLSELELKESEISSQYTQSHPVYATLLQQRAQLNAERESINSSVSMLPETQQRLLRLTRDVEVSSQVFLQLLNKKEELKVVRAGTVGSVRILEASEVGMKPTAPVGKVYVGIGAFIGLFMGLFVVVVRTVLNSGLKDPDAVQQKLNIPNYGVVPVSDAQQKLTESRYKANSVSVLAAFDKKDFALEAVRSIRTSLHFAIMESGDNAVMLTGPSPGIGKSFISTNLAALIGESGLKVLLIDADMRRGVINKAFGLERGPGLSEILTGIQSLELSIRKQVLPNLDLITTGDIPANPSELLMSSAFSELLSKAKSVYDLVLIDTPPTLAVTDPFIVGRQVGTTMVVVKHDQTSMRQVEQMCDRAASLGLNINGYIYNFMEFNAAGYSGFGAGYYSYGYYGLNEDED